MYMNNYVAIHSMCTHVQLIYFFIVCTLMYNYYILDSFIWFLSVRAAYAVMCRERMDGSAGDLPDGQGEEDG